MRSTPRHGRPPGGPALADWQRFRWLLVGLAAMLGLLVLAGLLVLTGGTARDRGTVGGEASRSTPTSTYGTSARRNPPPSVPSAAASSSSNTAATTSAPPAPKSAPISATPVPQPVGSPVLGPVSGLPISGYTGSASQLITVLAASPSSTTATVQAWSRHGTRWVRHGASISGELGSAGLTTQPSEQTPATPIGSFTLSQAFGAKANPGTALPYLKTTPTDWWIRQSGPLYNTHQRCAAHCPFRQAAPNEQLRYLTPADNYAVVIGYNTGPVRQGAGSAFFLQVSDGQPTAGCVAIPQQRLIDLLRWLQPSAQPRILIGLIG